MRFVLLLAYVPGGYEAASEEGKQGYVEAHHAFETYLAEHGRRLASAALADTDTATTVRHRDGEPVLSDGPFAETVEMLGGYYDVELPDLDHALAAARLLPAAYAVEVRPTVTIEGYEHRA